MRCVARGLILVWALVVAIFPLPLRRFNRGNLVLEFFFGLSLQSLNEALMNAHGIQMTSLTHTRASRPIQLAGPPSAC